MRRPFHAGLTHHPPSALDDLETGLASPRSARAHSPASGRSARYIPARTWACGRHWRSPRQRSPPSSSSRTGPRAASSSTRRPDAGEVAIFFYAWYGTPARDGGYVHWGQGGLPAADRDRVGFLPGCEGRTRRPTLAVLRAQLREIASAGVDTLIVSWWGTRERRRRAHSTRIAAEAGRHALHVAVHLEPYHGRTPASVATDLLHLRAHGVTDVYVYDATHTPAAEWATVLTPVDGAPGVREHRPAGFRQGRRVRRPLHVRRVPVRRVVVPARLRLGARSWASCAHRPSGRATTPSRATGDTRVRERRGGARYDAMWRRAIAARADVVTVTSYNEWHEGTQIEPARAVGRPYASYDGAWGLRGRRGAGRVPPPHRMVDDPLQLGDGTAPTSAWPTPLLDRAGLDCR